jgi:excisionase family DNA binding protein
MRLEGAKAMSMNSQARETREQQRRLAYSVRETVRTTNLSYASIYRLIKAGKIRSVKIGGRRLIPASALDALLEEGAQ